MSRIQEAESKTNLNPTEGQKISGNYKKGKIIIKGVKITIENPKGSIRSGVDSDDNSWENILNYTYGYINGTIGKDGDQIDIYLGDSIDEDFDVYIIDQVEEKTRSFDEHKVMFGFLSEEEAKQAYLSCYDKDWKGFESITTISLKQFKKWIKNKDMIKYPASKLNLSSRIDIKNVMKDEVRIIRLQGEVLEGVTLKKLQKQAGNLSNISNLVIEIASPGGSVSEGLEIMVWLDKLSNSGIRVISVVVANAYSIASLIMLAADVRLISKHGKVMVHNPMVPELQYVNANDLEKYLQTLRELESLMYELYEMGTGLDKDTIKELMDNETYLSPQEAVKHNFAQSVVDIKARPYEMVTNVKKEVNMSKTLNILNRVIGMVSGAEIVNQLYYDTEGQEIEIYQEDPSTYSKGDKTSLEEGEVKLSDGSLLVIKDFTIEKIDKSLPADETMEEYREGEEQEIVDPTIPVVEDNFNTGPEPKAEEVVEPVVEKSKDAMPGKVIEKTESTITTKETVASAITQISKWEYEVVQDTFELGTKVEYAPTEFEPEPYSVGAGEWALDDGRKVLTDADGIIRFIKEAEGSTEMTDESDMEAKKTEEIEAKKVEEIEAKKSEEIEAKKSDDTIDAKYDALEKKYEALDQKYEALNKKFEAIKSDKTEMSKKLDNTEKLSALTAEAIEAIAKTTTTNFKPEARKVVGETPQGSIFQRLKKQRGLS